MQLYACAHKNEIVNVHCILFRIKIRRKNLPENKAAKNCVMITGICKLTQRNKVNYFFALDYFLTYSRHIYEL